MVLLYTDVRVVGIPTFDGFPTYSSRQRLQKETLDTSHSEKKERFLHTKVLDFVKTVIPSQVFSNGTQLTYNEGSFFVC